VKQMRVLTITSSQGACTTLSKVRNVTEVSGSNFFLFIDRPYKTRAFSMQFEERGGQSG
jgi:hypothetical protein